MKNFKICLIAVALALFIAVPAMAGSPYVSLKGSLGTTDTGDIKLSHLPEGLEFRYTLPCGCVNKFPLEWKHD